MYRDNLNRLKNITYTCFAIFTFPLLTICELFPWAAIATELTAKKPVNAIIAVLTYLIFILIWLNLSYISVGTTCNIGMPIYILIVISLLQLKSKKSVESVFV
jgi:hypothetical protein